MEREGGGKADRGLLGNGRAAVHAGTVLLGRLDNRPPRGGLTSVGVELDRRTDWRGSAHARRRR